MHEAIYATISREKSQEGREQVIVAVGAYDLVDHPDGNYGVHGLCFRFQLFGGGAMIEAELNTNWLLSSFDSNGFPNKSKPPLGPYFEIATHSPLPLYKDHTVTHGCEYTKGDCYSTYNGLEDRALLPRIVADPNELWKELHRRLDVVLANNEKERANQRNFS